MKEINERLLPGRKWVYGIQFWKFWGREIVDNQNGYVYHMQFHGWLWTSCKKTQIQVFETYVAICGMFFCGRWQLLDPCGKEMQRTWKKDPAGLVEGELGHLDRSLKAGRPSHELASVVLSSLKTGKRTANKALCRVKAIRTCCVLTCPLNSLHSLWVQSKQINKN